MNNKLFVYPNEDPQIGYVELVDQMGDMKAIVNAARVSYGKEIKEFTPKDGMLLQYLIDNKHFSPFEHVIFSFRLKVPLFVARQHMRYRTWSFNEKSGRYFKETAETIEFYLPKYFRTQSSKDRQESNNDQINPIIGCVCMGDPFFANSAIREHCKDSYGLYEKLLQSGIAKEQARMVLPLNKYTEYIATVDLRNLLHFLEERDTNHAQWEIRMVAQAVKKLLIENGFERLFKEQEIKK